MATNTWVVRRRVGDEYNGDDIPDPADQYWAAFETEAAARGHARTLDRAEMLVNGTTAKVFENGFAGATTLPEFALRDWMLERDIPVPDGSTITDWRLWWTRMREVDRPVSRDQFRVVLEALDKLPLYAYEVVMLPTGEPDPPSSVVYAVVHHCWEYDDCNYGGANTALAAFRTRAGAEAEIARRTAEDDRTRRNTRYPGWNGGPNEYLIVELPINPEG